MDSLSSCLFLSEVSLQASLFVGFSHSTEVVLALSILFVSLSNLHCLLGSTFGFFDLFPGFFLFKLKESDSIGKQFGIVCCFLFVHASGNESAGYFTFAVIILFFLVVLFVLLLLSILILNLSLWYWLCFLRRFLVL
jgi:hypothetical protein